jgi:two-component system NtrC family sensor kinase
MNTKTSSQEYTLLIIDDDPSNLRVVTNNLEDHGFEIMIARNGQKGLELAEYARPDLILLNVIMPGIDGFETCRRLKAKTATEDIPVIFMTALTDIVGNVKWFEAGAVDYVIKPIQSEELFTRVNTHLHIRTLQKQLEMQNTLLGEQNTLLTQEILERKQAEKKLLATHKKLKKTLKHLKHTQTQLIESEKMATLGKLIANIAHEINSPVSAIRSSIGAISQRLAQILTELPLFFHSLSEERQQDFFVLLDIVLKKNVNLSAREEHELQRTLMNTLHEHMLDSTPDIAEMLVHIGLYENIQPFIPLLSDPEYPHIVKMVYLLSELHESAYTITIATDRASKIASALKTYAYPNQPSGKMIEADILEGIETTLMLYQNQWKHDVKVIRQYEDIPAILCYPGELNQVWTNLIHNALQAMDYKGILTINSRMQNGQVIISITDTGKGIPKEIQEKIFDPFFTTKLAGKGSGLGLDIAKKIVDKHQGRIHVESQPGNTTFRVVLPIREN